MEERDFREPWWFRHPVLAVALVLVAIVGLGAASWGVKVALSPVKGAGDVIIEQNKAKTIIGSQEELQERYHGILALCQQIPILREQAEKNKNFIAETNLASAKAAYLDRIGEYNAMTRKITAEKWVGELPRTMEAQEC